MKTAFVSLLGFCLFIAVADGRDEPVVFHDEKLEVALPDGWSESQQNQGGSDSVGGWESSDRKTSFYVLELRLQSQNNEMRAALEKTVANFDADDNWLVGEIGPYRDITVNDLPASYVRVELELLSGNRKVPFVFHFAMVGARNSFFLLQGSTMEPVWKVREDELIRLIKSFKVRKEE